MARSRSAITGRFVRRSTAARNPRTTVTESGSGRNRSSGTHHRSAVTGRYVHPRPPRATPAPPSPSAVSASTNTPGHALSRRVPRARSPRRYFHRAGVHAKSILAPFFVEWPGDAVGPHWAIRGEVIELAA